jgi:hypothetical protein
MITKRNKSLLDFNILIQNLILTYWYIFKIWKCLENFCWSTIKLEYIFTSNNNLWTIGFYEFNVSNNLIKLCLAVYFSFRNHIIINLNITLTCSISNVDYKIFVIMRKCHWLNISLEKCLFFIWWRGSWSHITLSFNYLLRDATRSSFCLS